MLDSLNHLSNLQDVVERELLLDDEEVTFPMDIFVQIVVLVNLHTQSNHVDITAAESVV